MSALFRVLAMLASYSTPSPRFLSSPFSQSLRCPPTLIALVDTLSAPLNARPQVAAIRATELRVESWPADSPTHRGSPSLVTT